MTYRHGNTCRSHSQFMRASAQRDNAGPPEYPVWDEYDPAPPGDDEIAEAYRLKYKDE